MRMRKLIILCALCEQRGYGFVNGYTVFSVEIKGSKKYLVLDVLVDEKKNQAKFQAFKDDGSCFVFFLMFSKKFSEQDLLSEACIDGVNYVKEVEGWCEECCDESLDALLPNLYLLNFIRVNCKSEVLAKNIEKLLR